jgi:hypothetical protein
LDNPAGRNALSLDSLPELSEIFSSNNRDGEAFSFSAEPGSCGQEGSGFIKAPPKPELILVDEGRGSETFGPQKLDDSHRKSASRTAGLPVHGKGRAYGAAKKRLRENRTQ